MTTDNATETRDRGTFVDAEGRTWRLRISIGIANRIKTELGVNLYSLDDGKVWQRLATDPETLVNVIWLIVAEQAAAADVSDEQFGFGLGGDTIDEAVDALLEAVIDFFPKSKRAIARKMFGKVKAFEDRGLLAALEKLDSEKVDQVLEQKFDQGIADLDQAIERALNKK